MNPRLQGVSGAIAGLTFSLAAPEVSIGRATSNDLCVADAVLSRKHCEIRQEIEGFVIRDLSSRHGTLVNGIPIQTYLLRHGDEITLGNSSALFLVDEQPVAARGNRAELSDTAENIGGQTLLHSQDSRYFAPGQASSTLYSERQGRELKTLLDIARGICTIHDRESLGWQVIGMIFDVVPGDRAAILFLDDDPERFTSSIAWDRVRGPGKTVRLSRTVVRRVSDTRSAVLVNNLPQDAGVCQSDAFQDFPVTSLLCAPVMVRGALDAVIYVDTLSCTSAFDAQHLEVTTAIANLVALALTNIYQFEALREENTNLRSQIGLEHSMVGSSPKMLAVYEFIRRVASTESTVLIQGESGTGKELVARAVHRNSARANAPFVAINCAAITESLLESELFGHEKGAFTGAVALKKGKFEVANGGTLFLDEVGELAPAIQAKLLRVLQERELERVGGTRPVKVDVRLITATNRDLEESVQAGAFRKDLFYRLNVVNVTMPPLRERREDIVALATHFVGTTSPKCKTAAKPLSPEAQSCLVNYDWPGNVRELENAIERALVLGSADAIVPEDFPEAILESGGSVAESPAQYANSLKESKKQVILQAVSETHGNYVEAAKRLGLHPNSLLRLIRRLGLKEEIKRTGA